MISKIYSDIKSHQRFGSEIQRLKKKKCSYRSLHLSIYRPERDGSAYRICTETWTARLNACVLVSDHMCSNVE